jgi:membrane dipeptidase
LILVLGIPVALQLRSSSLLEARLSFIRRLLSEYPLIGSSLNSYSETNFTQNYYEFREGMVGAIFWPIRVPCQAQFLDAVQLALEGIDEAKRIVDRTNGLKFVTSADEMEQAHNEGKIGVLLGLEGGHSLGSSVAVLRMFYSLGARFISLTSFECSNSWITAHTTKETFFEESSPPSMTEFGKVRESFPGDELTLRFDQQENSNYFLIVKEEEPETLY